MKLEYETPKLVFKMQKLSSPAFSLQVLGWKSHKKFAWVGKKLTTEVLGLCFSTSPLQEEVVSNCTKIAPETLGYVARSGPSCVQNALFCLCLFTQNICYIALSVSSHTATLYSVVAIRLSKRPY